MDDGGKKKNLDVDRLHLIDVSSEDDCLIAYPSGNLLLDHQSPDTQNKNNYFELFEAENALEGEDAADFLRQSGQAPVITESSEPEKVKKIGKCNLRKSLAWDNAFFTSAGVLDPDELSFITNGFKSSETHLLPRIQEDIRRSAESISTFDSDSLTLESLEVDLFEDIRASIQKSGKASKVAYPSSKAGLGEPGIQSLSSSKKAELPSRNRPIATAAAAAAKRQTISVQGAEKSTKEAFIRPRTLQPASRSGESNSSSLKPPKILGKANPTAAAPSKRTSLGTNRVKTESSTAKAVSVAGRGLPVVASKKPVSGASRSVTPRSTPSPKSATSGSPASKLELTAPYSSYDRSSSTSSESSGKSPLNSLRNKIDSRIDNLASSSSILKTSMMTSPRNGTDSGNSRLSTYLMSVSKFSSSISPAGSIDGWSSESSSSTSTGNQWSNNSKSSVDIISPSRGVSFAPLELDMQSHPHDQPCAGPGSHRPVLPSHCVSKASSGTRPLSHPVSADVSRNFKPSGLRMPSPKIGFFDAEKSALRTSNGGSQFHPGVHSGLPKLDAGISNRNGGVIKTKSSKHLPARTITGAKDIKLDSQHNGVLHPASSRRPTAQRKEPSKASLKASGTSRTTENCSGIAQVPNDLSPSTGREDHSNALGIRAELPNAGEFCRDSCLSAEDNGSQDALKSKLGIEKVVEVQSSEKAIYSQDRQKHSLHSIQNDNEKENLFRFEDQVDSLSRHVGAIDLLGKKSSSLPHFDVNNPENSGDPNLSNHSSKILVRGQKEDYLNVFSNLSPPSVSSTTMEIIPSTRTPLALKESFCNGLFEVATETTMEVAERSFYFPESMQEGNS